MVRVIVLGKKVRRTSRSAAGLLAGILSALTLQAQEPLRCLCDHATHAAYDQRNCGLCGEVDKAPTNVEVVFVKDNDPKKPNRWLALPRQHAPENFQLLSDVSPAQRTELWRQAIARAQKDWGDHWGLAVNGSRGRGQCHLHIHIGRLIEAVEWGEATTVDGPEQIPDPGLLGVWVHPLNGKLHVHVEMSAENVLAR
jgi:diadenosine tetraphosphate (Ap4A) HIT family hydrolase